MIYIYIFIYFDSTGVRVTGVVVGCLRKLQRWSFFSIIEEVLIYIYSLLAQKYCLEDKIKSN